MEIDVPESNGRDVSEYCIGWDRSAGGSTTLEHLMQLPRVVGDHRIGQQGKCPGDQDLFIAPTPTI
jgi:hypothetical protein